MPSSPAAPDSSPRPSRRGPRRHPRPALEPAERRRVAELRERLAALTIREERQLRRRLDQVSGLNERSARRAALDDITAAADAADRRMAARQAQPVTLAYPASLPIADKVDEIAAAIREHQVVVVAGETGSGKTTQLPKICLALGQGRRGAIGHTQPRRLAARAVADRLAEEIGSPVGEAVGYQVRFTDRVSDRTLVKVMTDGILLAELARDRDLTRYDTLIIDEAHERSLNIDFILGYLKRLLPRRPDLKVVITSATIDPARFSRHFDSAPVIEVSGRAYPVEVRYRPIVDPDDPDADPDRDQIQAVLDAVDELQAAGPGDTLVFLSGEREIRDTADALRAHVPEAEVLPLYARLSAAEQHRIFAPHPGRRIVLATNVAETSLTVPGIVYVIDAGTARISRYSHRTKVQRLPIERISRASADQRKGRCGRVCPGVCVRLYSEEDFLSRDEFTDPEIVRTNLASVILHMAALGLGEVAAFDFIDPPDRRAVADGTALLVELGAVDPAQPDPARRLTPIGRQLAQLPLDPRLGRMILAGAEQGCLSEVLVIAAALAIVDPRERPAESAGAADAAHARFADKTSDFLSYLNLWRYLRAEQKNRSSSAFRRMCRAEFLHYLRVREWQDLHGQLRQISVSLTLSANSVPAESPAIHRALLSGLLSHVGLKDERSRDYVGARNARFAVAPGSALFAKPPRWAVAGELVETSRLWARVVARIEPEWAEAAGAHVVKRSYSEPHWEANRAGVVAYEKATLYGVPLAVGRRVDYASHDPQLCRELFIRHALVDGDWPARHAFLAENRALLAELDELESRTRRRDLVVDDQTLVDFYDARIPADVVSGRHFDRWWKTERAKQPGLLTLTREALIDPAAGDVDESSYPTMWQHGELTAPLSYHFEPGSAADGVTAHVPVSSLNAVDPDAFTWQVPGLREELATALIRSLPKALRREFVPAPDTARAALALLDEAGGHRPSALPDELAAALWRLTGVRVPVDAWQFDQVPEHLKVTISVHGPDGRELARGKDVRTLQEQLGPAIRDSVSAALAQIERDGLRDWDFAELERERRTTVGGHPVIGYPALVDQGDSVAIRVLQSREEQRAAMWTGVRRLLLLSAPAPVKDIVRGMSNDAKLAIGASDYPTPAALLDDCVACAADSIIAESGGVPFDDGAFRALRDRARADLGGRAAAAVDCAQRVLAAAQRVKARLADQCGPAADDMRTQLAELTRRGFVGATGWDRLPELPRYMGAMEWRLDRWADNPGRDAERMAVVHALEDDYHELLRDRPRLAAARREEIRWSLEELRVSLFAQPLGTAGVVSPKRIARALDAARAAAQE